MAKEIYVDGLENLDSVLGKLSENQEKEELDNMLPTVESWVTTNNKDFFFSFKNVKTISSGLYSIIYTDMNGYGLTSMSYKGEEFLQLPSLPHQAIIEELQKFWENKHKFEKYNLNPKRGIILHGHPGCHIAGTKILMFDGTTKNVEDIVIGDKLMGNDNNPRTVLKLVGGVEEMYKITPNKGEPFIVNKNHVLHLVPSGNGAFKSEINLTVDEYLNKISKPLQEKLKLTRTCVDFNNPIDLGDFIDPYILGLWLGDGTSSEASLTTADVENEISWRTFASENNMFVTEHIDRRNARVKKLNIRSEEGTKGKNSILNKFKELDLFNNKHIPHIYKTNTVENRLKLLAGLIDSDGYTQGNLASTHNTGVQYVTKLETLANDIVYLCLSLGFYAKCTKNNKGCYVGKKKVFDGEYYSIQISGNLEKIPTKIPRKKAKIRLMNKDVKRTGFKCESVGDGTFYGFVVDSNHLYLTSDFVVHHNCGKTTFIYLLIEELKKLNGICILFDSPQNWVEIAKLVRKVEKTRPILCIIEDIDLIIGKYGEEVFLNFLDGLNSIENIVYVATTNNIEHIPDRIKNRPSRFDKTYEIKKPTDEDRLVFFETKIHPDDKNKYDINKLVKDTKNFTMAHIKEVFISLYILDNQYQEVIKRLKDTKLHDQPVIGFNRNDDD